MILNYKQYPIEKNMSEMLFTSESVTEGHPDKMSDQISDAILDALLEQDSSSRVACETMVTTGMVVVAGEVTSKALVDMQKVVPVSYTHLTLPTNREV